MVFVFGLSFVLVDGVCVIQDMVFGLGLCLPGWEGNRVRNHAGVDVRCFVLVVDVRCYILLYIYIYYILYYYYYILYYTLMFFSSFRSSSSLPPI